MIHNDSNFHKTKRIELALELTNNDLFPIKISDKKVLAAIKTVPRHLFFSNWNVFLEEAIYKDIALHIGNGRTISRPYITALMIQLLEIKPNEKVLEIGTGIGYTTALLSSIGATTHTVENNENFYKKAQETLSSLAFENFSCYHKDVYSGLHDFAPYNKILINKSIDNVLDELLGQLAIGGIMVVPIICGSTFELTVITKNNDTTIATEVISNEFVFGALV